jgi:hypothetical protein
LAHCTSEKPNHFSSDLLNLDNVLYFLHVWTELFVYSNIQLRLDFFFIVQTKSFWLKLICYIWFNYWQCVVLNANLQFMRMISCKSTKPVGPHKNRGLIWLAGLPKVCYNVLCSLVKPIISQTYVRMLCFVPSAFVGSWFGSTIVCMQ